MRLFFDARYIRTDFHDGISRYSTELAGALTKLTPVTFIICDEKQRDFLPNGAKCIKIHAPTSIKEPFTALILNKYQPDVVFTPLQTMGSLGRKFKLILNQQDMTYYKGTPPPSFLSAPVRLGWWLYHRSYWPGRLTLNVADIVATVSETSKQEILDAKLTTRPVVAVPNAAENLSRFLKNPVELAKEPPKDLIYMGAFLPHKNVETLVTMMQFLPDHTLHLCSRITEKRKVQLKELASPSAKIVFHNGISDEKYAALLANNAILVSASKAEGFGLPLAEALTLGVPAVVSDMPIFHEVAGGGALYAEPDNPSEFAKKIISLDSLKTRQALVKAGKKHISRFSWNASAKVLLAAAKALHTKHD